MGIGAAAVNKFIKEGWNVGFMDINVAEANKVLAQNDSERLLFVDDYWKAENDLYARGCAGKPEEAAEVIYFLASEASSFCTGGHYLVDGGLVAR